MARFMQILLLMVCLAPMVSCGQKDASDDATPRAAHASWNGQTYDVYTVHYPKDKVRLYWRNAQQQKLVSLRQLKNDRAQQHEELLFGTNAGMYMVDNTPLGLYVENGRQYRPLNQAKHKTGNFYIEPNGVFLLTKSEAAVVTTAAYKDHSKDVMYATQSGPMLVTGGTINPNFTKGSANVNIRSGVGIAYNGDVVFVISDGFVNFYDIATLFRDKLKCRDALFLDGAICQMFLPQLNRWDTGGNFGAMIGVVK